MQLKKVLAALALMALAACGGGNSTRQVELDPEGVNTPRPTDDSPDLFERMFGGDSRPNVGPCPLMGVLYESSRIVEFAQPNVERYANIAFTGEITGVNGLCRYVDADPIRMRINMQMAFGRGPAATAETKTYRYWVAVARRGMVPIEKQYFDVQVRFPAGQNVVTGPQEIREIVIPRATPETSGENFEILVGFDLTPAQLQFNRDGKRFRLDSVTNTPQAAQ
ncbi:MAG: Tat pathway signal sequence domain protein [Caulobacterales bacterium]